MIQDVYVKLNPGLPLHKQHSTRRGPLLSANGLKFKEETSEVLHLEYSFEWCWKLDTSESKSEMPGKFWNVVMEKDGTIGWEMKKCYHESKKRGTSNIQLKEGRLNGLVISCIGTAILNTLLKETVLNINGTNLNGIQHSPEFNSQFIISTTILVDLSAK